MVLAPINTDAPIYHWPRATVGLIAANVIAFLATSSGSLGTFEDVIARYGLVHGEGLQPWQWLTSNFVHHDWLHLAGNMLFLWGLGLVVEGKIGWQRFLAVYLGLGIAECALEQTALSFVRFDSYGSSAIIFGLLAIALVWAPKNDLIVGFWIPVFGVGAFDVSIGLFCFIVVAVQGLMAWWVGPTVLLHLIGALLGFAVGTGMVRRGLVDCEGWDLYSVLKGRTGTPTPSDNYTPIRERPLTERPSADTPAPRKRMDPDRGAVLKKVKAIKRIRALLQRNQALEACEFLRRTQHLLDDWQLPAEDHLALADALQQAQQWNEAVKLWEDYLERRPQSEPIRIQAAAVILDQQQRPHAALRMLEPLRNSRLHPSVDQQRKRIVESANQMIESGVIEFDQAAWR